VGIDLSLLRQVEPADVKVDDEFVYTVTGESVKVVESHEHYSVLFYELHCVGKDPFYAIDTRSTARAKLRAIA